MGVLDLFRLDDQVALVTGAGQGIGREIAMALSEAGARLVVADINSNNLERTADEISKVGGEVLPIVIDLKSQNQVEEMIAKIISHYGKLDILVNNAGLNKRIAAKEIKMSEWDDVVDLNLKAAFFCCQAAGKEMIKNKKGTIINLGSISGVIINKEISQVAYSAAKAGVINLTRALAAEWAPYHIRVNCISPGLTLTPQVEGDFVKNEYMRNLVIENTPMRRFANPSEIASVVVFLASNASSFVNGHNLISDGGYTIW